MIPKNRIEAAQWIKPVIGMRHEEVAKLSNDELKKIWKAVFYLNLGLHPDSIEENGLVITEREMPIEDIYSVDPRICTPYYEASRWPVYLMTLAAEVIERYERGEVNGDFGDDDYYPSEAQRAGVDDLEGLERETMKITLGMKFNVQQIPSEHRSYRVFEVDNRNYAIVHDATHEVLWFGRLSPVHKWRAILRHRNRSVCQ